jgi:hypothetical protein
MLGGAGVGSPNGLENRSNREVRGSMPPPPAINTREDIRKVLGLAPHIAC